MREMGAFKRGSWDADILEGLAPDPQNPNEIVIDKTRNTAFWHTTFERHLQDRGINQLLVTGVGTNVCVESTVRDAVTNNYYCRTISNATATLTTEDHEASLRNLNWFGGTAKADEILEALRARQRSPRQGS